MNKQMILDRVQASIRPVLDWADALYEFYRPLDEQIIGKHHPLFDTFAGRRSYLKRRMSQINDSYAAKWTDGDGVEWKVHCDSDS